MVMVTSADFAEQASTDDLETSFSDGREWQIRQVIEARTSGRIRGLSVQVDGTKLVISGQSSTYYGKQLATHAALDVAETLLIQNDVLVASPR